MDNLVVHVHIKLALELRKATLAQNAAQLLCLLASILDPRLSCHNLFLILIHSIASILNNDLVPVIFENCRLLAFASFILSEALLVLLDQITYLINHLDFGWVTGGQIFQGLERVIALRLSLALLFRVTKAATVLLLPPPGCVTSAILISLSFGSIRSNWHGPL